MYNDVKKKTDFQIATETDIQEIRDVIDYASSLIIKNQQEADRYETIDTVRKATVYVSAVYNLNDSDNLDRHIIIESYEEKNKYYQELKDNYDIPYAEARNTKNFKVMKVMKNTLDREDEILFHQCYNETLEYYSQVIYTKAFNNQDYVYEYYKTLIMSMTIQKYLTRKLGYFFNIDLYDKKKLKNAFISYGFDYFDSLPLNYQRRLLKLLNELVQSKGTNSDIRKLLNVFGFKNIDIYKYILTKSYKLDNEGRNDYNSPFLVFYKTKADEIIDYDKDIVLNYDSVVNKDPFWKCDKQDVLDNKDFNTITSKYMSVDLTLDIIKETMNMSYFMAFLYKMQKDYKDKQDTDFGFYNRNMSSRQIHIFDAIVGLQVLILKSHKLKDNINKTPNQALNIYGYGNIENNQDIKDLLEEIQILLIQNEYQLEWKRQYFELYQYFQSFNLKNFNEPTDYDDMKVIYDMYDNHSDIQSQFLRGIPRYTDDYQLEEYLENPNNDLIDRLDYLRGYLIQGKYRCQDLYTQTDFAMLFSKFLLIQGHIFPHKRLELNNIFVNNKDLAKEIRDFTYVINTASIVTAYEEGDYFKVIDLMIKFISARRAELKKLYNITSDEDLYYKLISDKQDIVYYKELYAFYEVAYKPFRSIREDKKYTTDNFVNIFLNNEKLRTQLMRFIKETDNYQLYKRFNNLFDIKMLTKFNTEVYDGFETFSEYIENKNIEFYDWLTINPVDEVDKVKRKEFYQSRIFELCESIDNYISLDLFMSHTFTGVIDYIRKILYLVITVFKSYTIDLLDSNTVLYVDDSSFNSIRMFDEIGGIQVKDQVQDRISLQDVSRTWVKDRVTDNISLREEIKIIPMEE